jgi:hypothetical protein
MPKFTKKDLNLIFLAITGIVHPETGILDNLAKQDKGEFEQLMIKLDSILEDIDKDEQDKNIN